MDEPSVLDYVKERLTPWRKHSLYLAPSEQDTLVEIALQPEKPVERSKPAVSVFVIPWLVVGSFLLALTAQRLLEPPLPRVQLSIILYVLSAGLVIWAAIRRDWILPMPAQDLPGEVYPFRLRSHTILAGGRSVRVPMLVYPILLGVVAYWTFSGNLFTPFNVVIWILAILLLIYSLWPPARSIRQVLTPLNDTLRAGSLRVTITPWTILVLAAVALVTFFRFYRLAEVPGEMFSDHAEKLLDVADVLQGNTYIFFTRNTGREAFQFYLTAAVSTLFDTGLSFMSLKIGTALAGLFTLPFIYLLGKEFGTRWTGLVAMALAGIAYWPNVIARIGLRFPLYPLFVAPALYFLVRALRRRSFTDFIWSGLFLGIGLHGYSATRLLPFVIVIAVGIYWLHHRAADDRSRAFWGLAALALVSLFVFLPLLRYIVEDPYGMFGYRALSRLGQTERAFIAPVWQVFLNNLWSAWIMPFYKNGNIWVHSIPNRPALDWITAALYFLGTVALLYRYVRNRHWLDLFLLVAVPLLMLPSILSLAFPEENPSLNRTGGAIVPVFVIAAFGLETLLISLRSRFKPLTGAVLVLVLVGGIFIGSIRQNYDLVFRQFDDQFMSGAWNTSDIGEVIHSFSISQNTPDNAYVIPYPHWVDTRLVGIRAGYPLKDYALWRDQLQTTLSNQGAKLFIYFPEDLETAAALNEMYPDGSTERYIAPVPGKDFMMFFVPPVEVGP